MKNDFLRHFGALQAAVLAQGAQFLIAGDSMNALIRRDRQHWVLRPQFVGQSGGKTRFSSVLTDEMDEFAGWYPKIWWTWAPSADKLAFKRLASALGFSVPEFSVAPDSTMTNVLIKRAGAPTVDLNRGPLRTAAEEPLNIAMGDYYERFVDGRPLRAWYWNGSLMGLETIGNADSGGREAAMSRAEGELNSNRGADLSRSLPSSPVTRHDREWRKVSLQEDEPRWTLVRRLGRSLHQSAPEPDRTDCLFAVEAIQDAAGQTWFLSLESNPVLPPWIYSTMLSALIRDPQHEPAG